LKAVIIAAGKAERLRPLTSTKPKQLIPIGGRPQLEWLLKGVADSGIKDVLLITHYMEEKIKSRFGDGEEIGVKLHYARQEEMRGTGDAFSYAEKFAGKEDFLGMNGDLYLSPGILKEVVKAHGKGELTVTGLERDPYLYGALRLQGDRVQGIIEKPTPGTAPSNVTNAGIYVFPHSIFDAIKATKLSPRGEIEVTDSVNSLIASGVTARVHMLGEEDWLDIGHPWHVLEANTRALARMEPRIEGTVEDGAHLTGPVYVAPSARIRSGVYIEGPVYIGPDCDVGPNNYIRAGTTLVGSNRVGASCEVKNTIFMEKAAVPHLSYVGDSIIGERCNLGAGTITANLRFDHKNVKMTVKDKRVDTGHRKLGAVFGDDCQTGVNVSIHPGVKVGAGAWIAPGVTVDKDVPEGVLLTSSGAQKKPKSG
jgi:UDP-N-acetylglucosamine diphosphorylase / glucose-1-phosphate thymidylyltransferase / UDP-N-acetylgalactosamine diphosphorylase / glucosamine-1-phosphate N-acetyltransferase / galactosamine-1-phosphate N-acetyltransferase